MRDKTIGILGGMGPEATASLFRLIIKNTRADKDQDHVPVLIYNNPKIPDRSAYILGQGPSPVPALKEGSQLLEKAGVCCILWPCNTAHYFHGDIAMYLSVPLLNMIRETAVFSQGAFPPGTTFGLLTTLGTYQTYIYEKMFDKKGLILIRPDEENRKRIMESIYGSMGIKAGYKQEPIEMLRGAVVYLRSHGADVLISGCTELSLVLSEENTGMPVINPMYILARAAILYAGYPLKE